MMVEWRILTPEEEKALDEASTPPPEIQAELDKRAAWDEKHPRCETCGQFLKKKPPLKENELSFSLRQDDRDQWYSHYVRDYWGEYDHI